jgi:hypothetical protein
VPPLERERDERLCSRVGERGRDGAGEAPRIDAVVAEELSAVGLPGPDAERPDSGTGRQVPGWRNRAPEARPSSGGS